MSGLEGLRDSAVINLTGAVTMVVDDSPFGLDITASALLGFGIKTRYACHSAAEAMDILKDHPIDLLVVDTEMPEMDGYELVRWLRRSGLDPNAFAPVIMTATHVRRSRVTEARDCGANFVITKPFSAASLLERIVFVARDTRPFLEVGDYFGPDRRFREGKAPGQERRADVLRKMKHAADKAAAAAGAEHA
jgi:CheY-like chemotaxis protein